MPSSFGQNQLVLTRDAQPVFVAIVNNHDFLPALEQADGFDHLTDWLLAGRGWGAWGDRGIQNSHSNAMSLKYAGWLSGWLTLGKSSGSGGEGDYPWLTALNSGE